MTTLRLILGDQLSPSIPTLTDIDIDKDVILLCEVMEEATYVKHHKKKIAFIFSAMRHFASQLGKKKYNVRYIKIDDPANTQSFSGEVKRAIIDTKATRIIVTEPSEYRVLKTFKTWHHNFHLPVEILADTRFLSSHEDFSHWAKDKKQLRMEFFYREMRQKYHILMEGNDKPTGGRWNFDKENRKPLQSNMLIPRRTSHEISQMTRDVLDLVRDKFPDHFGTLEPFQFATSRDQALIEVQHFIHNSLPHFGDYQDAMMTGEPYLYHAIISMYLNVGLVLPLEVCQMAERAYREGRVPLNAAEGFIRQILGWREYIRGIYWHFMPGYAELNSLDTSKDLPDFYWTANTKMFCVAQAVSHTRDYAYSHHIQRLMITGNFALLSGLDVKKVQEWYLAVYADAFEWVEMPNTLGMALFGDGGIVASKPYAASGKYINRMSNYCKSCPYNPDLTVGEKACPFNSLYWDFIARHQNKLRGNQRMPYVFSTWEKFGAKKQVSIRQQAATVLQKMENNQL